MGRVFAPWGEGLESRVLLAGFTAVVDNTSDSPLVGGTLRDAIMAVDLSTTTPNSIVFNIPKSDPGYNPSTGTFTISPLSELPQITNSALIDGTSESTFLGEPALVLIDGSEIKGTADGLTVASSAPGSTIIDLEILGFDGSGIVLESSGNTIGGTASDDGTILVSNSTAGISIAASPGVPAQGSDNLLLGNFIGTDPRGDSLGNGVGVIVGTQSNTIGGITSDAANVFGFNTAAGLQIDSNDELVIGNLFGTNSAGANLGNAVGVSISGSSNTIGEAGGANTIGFSAQQGVSVLSGSGNVISQNLYDGTNGPASPVQANDISVSPGANNSQVAPTLVSLALSGATLMLQAYETSATPTLKALEIYLDTPTRRSFLISTPVTLSNDPSSPTVVTVTVPGWAIGDNIIATVTDPTNGTSAFSASTPVSTTSQGLYIVSQDPDGTDNDLYYVNLNAISGGLFTSYTSIPLTSTMGLSTQIRGLAYDNNNGTMYGITAQGNLVTVNLNTGAESLVYTLPVYAAGSSENFWSGMAFDGTNNLYVANAYGDHELVEIPVNSPSSAFVVGSITNTSFGSYHPQTLGLAFYPASAPSIPPTFDGTDPAPGVLYGSDRGTDSINAINTSTASATQLNPGQGTTGVNNLQESVFGPSNGLLYSVYDNAVIATYNFLTGTEAILGQLPFGILYDGPPGTFGEGNYGAGGMGFGPFLATVSGTVYNDLNGSGTLQPGDPGLQGWTVNLEDSSGTILATTTSDAKGNYQFANVSPGSYIVADVLQSGWDQTQPVNPNYYSIATQFGQNETGLNFGNFNVYSTFTVINTNDSGPGSLRAAIIHANQDPGNTIIFAIPTNLATPPGTSTFVIMPKSALPTVTAATTIDGTTESLFLGKPAVVQINGSCPFRNTRRPDSRPRLA